MKIPDYVLQTTKALSGSGYEAYIVGGCVRDFLMKKVPTDWDIATNARPEEILKVFPQAKYKNVFGTVLLPIRDKADSEAKPHTILEITTYRSESNYSDSRHPDEVVFETSLAKDLSRRDFTINALAIDPQNPEEVIDLYKGKKDIKLKIVRAIGEPVDRFKEDALRMLRAVRFCAQLGFSLEPKTQRGVLRMAGSIKFVSNERIRDELIKILASDDPASGIELLRECKLLQYILPELLLGLKVQQDRHHIYPVYKHNLLALKYCPNPDWQVRLAALLHDIGKPKTRKIIDNIATFYNHEYVGAKMVDKIMRRLKFSNEDRERVVNLVKNHMFYYNVGEVSAASVRRLVAKVGKENLSDLIDLRVADRLGSGTPKAMPYKLRHLQYMMEKVQHDPVSVKMLKIDGNDLMTELKVKPGPKIGAILDVLLAEVIEDPEINKQDTLIKRADELRGDNLSQLRSKARELISDKREEEDKNIKKQFKV